MALQRRVSFNENPRVFKQTSLISDVCLVIFGDQQSSSQHNFVGESTSGSTGYLQPLHWFMASNSLFHLAATWPIHSRKNGELRAQSSQDRARSYNRKKDLQEQYGDMLCLLTLLFELLHQANFAFALRQEAALPLITPRSNPAGKYHDSGRFNRSLLLKFANLYY